MVVYGIAYGSCSVAVEHALMAGKRQERQIREFVKGCRPKRPVASIYCTHSRLGGR